MRIGNRIPPPEKNGTRTYPQGVETELDWMRLIEKTDRQCSKKCKLEAMHSTVRHKCLLPPSAGGGGVGTCEIGMAKFGALKIWHKFVNSMAEFGTKFPDEQTPQM